LTKRERGSTKSGNAAKKKNVRGRMGEGGRVRQYLSRGSFHSVFRGEVKDLKVGQ